MRTSRTRSIPSAACRVYSLYGDTRKPKPEQLAGLDALVFDIQDVGTRFYTYIATMGLAMEAAAAAHVKFIVLDRVNPIGGVGRRRAAAAWRGELHRLALAADPPRDDRRRAGADVQRRAAHRRRPHRDPADALAPRAVDGRGRTAVDQHVAEHAQRDRGGAVSGHRHRGVGGVGRTRNGDAVRNRRRAVHRRRGARARADGDVVAGDPLRGDDVHAVIEQSSRSSNAAACG